MESSFRAARDGLDASLWYDGRLRPVPEIARATMQLAMPHARELGLTARWRSSSGCSSTATAPSAAAPPSHVAVWPSAVRARRGDRAAGADFGRVWRTPNVGARPMQAFGMSGEPARSRRSSGSSTLRRACCSRARASLTEWGSAVSTTTARPWSTASRSRRTAARRSSPGRSRCGRARSSPTSDTRPRPSRASRTRTVLAARAAVRAQRRARQRPGDAEAARLDVDLVHGQTDSEHYFALMTKRIAEHDGDVAAGIAAAASEIGRHPALLAQHDPDDAQRPLGAPLPGHQ